MSVPLRAALRNLGAFFATSGSALVAQVIALASMTLVARLYSSSAIGLLALATNTVAFLVPLASLSFTNAMLFARRDREAVRLAQVAGLSALVIAMLVVLTSPVWAPTVVRGGEMALWIAAAIVATVLAFAQRQLAFRHDRIAVQARSVVVAALVVACLRLVGGALGADVTWLFASVLAAPLLQAGWIARFGFAGSSGGLLRLPARRRLRATARRHRDFARYMTPLLVARYAALALPTWFIAARYGTGEAGQYGLAYILVIAPVGIFIDSITGLMTRPLARRFEVSPADAARAATRMSGIAFLLGVLFIAACLLVLPPLVPFLFGEKWTNTALYAALLSPWLASIVVTRPLNILAPMLHRQRALLAHELLLLALRFLALFLGASAAGLIGAIAAYSAIGVVGSLVSMVIVHLAVPRAR